MTNHTVTDILITADDTGLEQEKDAPCGVYVRVGLSTDRVNEFMAKRQATKRPSRSWLFLAAVGEQFINLLSNSNVLWIGLAVHQQGPVKIAPLC